MNMKTILVCNSKGGVGKSLIADELAFSFERTGTPMSFYDLDSQGGTIHKTKEDPNAKVVIVDTPGALQSQLTEYMKAADVIVIPTRTTSRDIEPLQRMQAAVKANAPKAKVVYVLNAWNRWRASRDFSDWFVQNNGVAMIAKIPQSEVIVQASAFGESVVTYAKGTNAAESVRDFCNLIRDLSGFEREE